MPVIQDLLGWMQSAPGWQHIAAISTVAAFPVLLADKWGITGWMQRKACWPFYELARCQFCMAFWAGTILCAIFAIVTGQWSALLYPFATTPITRKLL